VYQCKLSVTDSNNTRNIGIATTDACGMYSLNRKPDLAGNYTVTAAFVGSQSYWGSSTETSFSVNSAAPTASPYPQVSLPPIEMYIAAASVAIIVAIAIVGVMLAVMLRKRP
jgi:hypothetical protein